MIINRRKSQLLINTKNDFLTPIKSDYKNLKSEGNKLDFNDASNSTKNNNIISNEPLFSLKETLICTFCGGKNCKHENFLNHKNPAIYGLNSDKIDDNIYASQRPSNSLIKKYDLITKFKELEIGFIVNLQLPGEHPYCGPDPLYESGFSYSPSLFESEGIHVGLYGWNDLDVPNSLYHMLQVVKTMYDYIHNLKKKVLVHCHAGYGRTGTTIACYKIFDECISAEAAKDEIRKVRSQCIQNKNQFNYCVKFQEYIRRLKGNFCLKETRSIENFLKYQDDLNIGKYNFINFTYNKYVPIFLLYIFDAIIDIKNKTKIDELSLYNYLNGFSNINETDEELMNTIIKNVNEYNWDILYSCEEPIILKELLFDWLKNSVEYIFNPEHISKLDDNFLDFEKQLKTYEYQTLLIVCKFLKLIKDKEENKEIEKQRDIFIENFCKYSLGYSKDENTLRNYEVNNVDKLVKLINLINNEQNNINKEEEDEDKTQILSNVYEQLKEYFENKNGNKKLEIQQKNGEDMFNKINTLMNSVKNPSVNVSKDENNNNINNRAKTNKEIGLNFKKENEKANPNANAGIINFNNLNNSTIKLSKTMKINIRKSKSLFKESIDIIKEIEDNTDIPWIREEDC